MTMPVFSDILLRRDGSNRDEKGNLTIGPDSIQFEGSAETFSITNIQFVSTAHKSGSFSGDWVKVEYGDDTQPSVAYLKEKEISGGVGRIYSAMQHFPNSRQFECKVWAYRNFLRPAPRKPGGYATARKGFLASTRAKTLALLVRNLKCRENVISDIAGYTRELLTAKQQWVNKMLELLIIGAGVGFVLVVGSLFLSRGNGELALVDLITNLLSIFAIGLGLVFIGGFLVLIPALMRIRTVDLFTLKFKKGGSLDFGVDQKQSEQVVQTLESWGLSFTGE